MSVALKRKMIEVLVDKESEAYRNRERDWTDWQSFLVIFLIWVLTSFRLFDILCLEVKTTSGKEA